MKVYIRTTLTVLLLFSSVVNAGWKTKAINEVVELFGPKIGRKIPGNVSDELAKALIKAAKEIPESTITGINRMRAGKLIVKYGDDAVHILIKQPDNGLWALENGGGFVAKNYKTMNSKLFQYIGKTGKQGSDIVEYLGVGLANDVIEITGNKGLKALRRVTNPSVLQKAINNTTDKVIQSNLVKNTIKYGDEFLQFTLKYKKSVIFAPVIVGGIIYGRKLYLETPDSIPFDSPDIVFNKDGIPVGKNGPIDYFVSKFSNKRTNSYKNIQRGLDNYSKYKNIIEPIITKYKLPKSLVALAIIESSLDPLAGSSKGAVGPWQFIKSTAKDNGLIINKRIDERRDIEKSTHAACKHLKRLYNIFGNWPLAMAAYNTGEGNLKKWLKIFNTNDFWQLAQKSKENSKKGINAETRDYVPQVLALLRIMNEPEKYSHHIFDNKQFEYEEVKIDGKRNIYSYAEASGLSADELLRDYNPELYTKGAKKHLRKMKIPKGYLLKIPKGKKQLFNNYLSKDIVFYYEVQEGDTLSEIAEKNKVWAWRIKRRNKIKNENLIRIGQLLEIPMIK